MVEPIRDLPPGVLGFWITGRLERDDDGERDQASAWLAE